MRPLIRIAAAALLAGCSASGTVAPPAADGPAVTAWVTTGDRTKLLAREDAGRFAGGGAALPAAVVEVDPAQRFQRIAGFGASITDATAWLMQVRMKPAQRDALIRELFGREGEGVGFDLTRFPIGASDFSRSHYSFDDLPAGETDPTLARFSIDPQRGELLPVLKAALAVNPGLQVMASPWSAPGWMKTSGSLKQGALKPEHHETFARYLLKTVDAFAAEGVPIFAITLQNEPHFEPPDYPGMRVDPAARAQIIGRHLGPMVAARGGRPQIIEWDHNWDDPQAPLAVLGDATARPFVSGVGWHCYAGAVDAQSLVHDRHPDKDTWFTECSGGEWAPRWPETLPWMMKNVVIGSVRHWARGVLMWNLALDENHGPHLGGCKDCRGVVTIDSATGAVTRNLEYYALAHASRFVRPGAWRVASTQPDGLDTVAFVNADDGSRVLVLSNAAAQEKLFGVRVGGVSISYRLPRESVATLVWPGSLSP